MVPSALPRPNWFFLTLTITAAVVIMQAVAWPMLALPYTLIGNTGEQVVGMMRWLYLGIAVALAYPAYLLRRHLRVGDPYLKNFTHHLPFVIVMGCLVALWMSVLVMNGVRDRTRIERDGARARLTRSPENGQNRR